MTVSPAPLVPDAPPTMIPVRWSRPRRPRGERSCIACHLTEQPSRGWVRQRHGTLLWFCRRHRYVDLGEVINAVDTLHARDHDPELAPLSDQDVLEALRVIIARATLSTRHPPTR